MNESAVMDEHEIHIRVRYCETDAMGFLHHSHYVNYFESGRTELFRANGGDYRAMEKNGFFLVVVRLSVRFRLPARYDDLLTLRTKIVRLSGAKLEHAYQVFRDSELLVEGDSTLACVDREGNVCRLTDELLYPNGRIEQ